MFTSEFKHLEHFYFHNCLYDFVWKDNRRRHAERTPVLDILHKYPADYKLVFVGDATMSPYEILQPGGSVEYHNSESGAVWMQRMLDVYKRAIWINPEPEAIWPYRQSVQILRQSLQLSAPLPTRVDQETTSGHFRRRCHKLHPHRFPR